LIEQTHDALRARPIAITIVLIDLQLERCDHRLVLGKLRTCCDSFSFDPRNLGT
jgi:hypothetical protein